MWLGTLGLIAKFFDQTGDLSIRRPGPNNKTHTFFVVRNNDLDVLVDIETDFGKHVADLELKSTPGIGTGGKRSSEDYDNARVAEKKRKRDEKQQRDESQMSEQEVAALRRRERLETAERRRKEAQSKKDEKM